MNLTLRYIALGVFSILSLHYLASFTSSSYQHRVDTLRSSWSSTSSLQDAKAAAAGNAVSLSYADTPKANATFIVLCREGEINEILGSIQLLESTFNDRPHHRYPYTFLNDKPFSDNFKLRITRAVSSTVEFGLVPPEMWDIPAEVDLDKARKSWEKAARTGMPYGGSQSYRQMCRFQSGYFFRHPLVLKYKYYWRVEPNVKYFCDLTDFDPFRFMEQNKKKYGFVLSMHDIPLTIRSLWIHVREWYEKNSDLLAPNNLFGFITENNGRGYNKVRALPNPACRLDHILTLLSVPSAPLGRPFSSQSVTSGVTSRLQIWTSTAQMPISLILTTWTRQANFSTSAGEMLPSTRSVLLCSSTRTSSTTLTTLATSMRP